jgi:hypothetical protein
MGTVTGDVVVFIMGSISEHDVRAHERTVLMSVDDVMQLNVRETLAFFDGVPPESKKHATAIVAVCGEELGIGLLKHYLEGQSAQVDVRGPCTKGVRRGPRLDRWVRVQCPSLELPDVLFQVEVKNWSAHAIGGEPLPLDASPEAIAAYKVRNWSKEWDECTGIRKPGLAKLLEPMRPP